MTLVFLLIPLLCIFAINLPKAGIASKMASWLVALAAVTQIALAASYQLPIWQPLDNLLKLPAPLGLSIDAISALMLVVIGIVSCAANAVGFHGDGRKLVNARSLVLLLMAGLNGIVLVRDLFSIYIFLEIAAVACFILIAIDREEAALAGAFKYFILSGIATFALLVANALIFLQAGGLSFAAVRQACADGGPTIWLALVLYIVAFCVKAGVAPFHGWLPDAHASAPSAVSVLLSGVVIKAAGTYLVIRMMGEVFVGHPAAGQAFMALGAFSIVLGAFAAIGQRDLKRMLAFSSVSQMGYIVLAAGLGTPLALVGALIHIINHALFKSLLFVNAAAVKEQTGTVQLAELGGLAERMRVTGWTSVIGFLSAAGLPPLSGFWSKLLILIALGAAGQWAYLALALLMSLVTLGYFLVMQRNVFFGHLKAGFEQLSEARASLQGTSLALAGLTTAFGLLFPFVLVFMQNNGWI